MKWQIIGRLVSRYGRLRAEAIQHLLHDRNDMARACDALSHALYDTILHLAHEIDPMA